MRHEKLRAIFALACAAILLCGAASAEPSRAQQALDAMTLHEKVGQLFIVRPEALAAAAGAQGDADALRLTDAGRAGLAAYPVGGVVFFGSNLASPEQLGGYIADLQAASRLALFVAVDEEGGPVARLGNAPGFDVPQVGSMGSVGDTGDVRNAREAGRTIGGYISEYGFNLDFAPVADVNTNPDNVVIGRRAFGSDPVIVAEMVRAALAGLHDAGVMGCVKHFPGHGDTSADTHEGYVRVDKTWEELLACELVPFITVLGDADMVMVAHIAAPNATGDDLPASLSRRMIQDGLRGALGYDGVVITDALEMGAISNNFGSAQAAVLAIQAGADLLLMPVSLPKAFEAVEAAVQDGTISEARLDESVLRILRLKERYGLL